MLHGVLRHRLQHYAFHQAIHVVVGVSIHGGMQSIHLRLLIS
ncbi:hypothetical protein NC652_020938 [Populus alba x Populus x berolinensis]|nr:hypothetical protein NC652_020938 [Populus alba x Populus x berolinensis]